MRTTRSLVLGAEAALAVVTLASILGMARLFVGGSWLAPLALHAVVAHAAAAVLRRRGVSLALSGGAMVLGAGLVSAWTSYWSTTAAGIPTGTTWSTMSDDLSSAWALYQHVVAPAPVEPGFLLASSLAVWCIAFIGDWAAFRLWVPFEATLPAGTLFLFTALLGTDRGRTWAVGLFAAAVLGFLLVHRLARQEGTSHWVADHRAMGQRSLLGVGAALGAAAVLAGSIVGPALPGADAAGVLDPRSLRDGDDARKTISPLVDIRSRLVNQSDIEVFTVSSPTPSYWRLTSLERFDGTLWSSSGRYGEVSGALPRGVDVDVATEAFEQSFTISALSAIWLPSAYEPRALVTDGLEVRYDDESATLIVDNDVPTSDGLTYEVVSTSPRLDAARLASPGDVPAGIRERYLSLPDDFSQDVRRLAQDIVAGAATPYEQARALQDHLRTFEYSLEVLPGHGTDAIDQFLFVNRRGYCEQFAGSFAAMARAVGLPARVAVGFTQGETDPADPELYRVRGEHAHAWPEVYLAGSGWVAFEPTPGRGMPFAESYTGVTPAQAAPSNPGAVVTSPPTTPSETIPGDPSTGAPEPDPLRGLDTGGGAGEPTSADSEGIALRYLWRPFVVVVPIVAVLLAAYLLLLPVALLVRQRLRRRRADTPEGRIGLAWTESAESAALVGFSERLADTHHERAAELGRALPDAAGDAALLAELLDVARYSPAGADDEAADAADEAASHVANAARVAATRPARVQRWLDPRPIVGAWRLKRSTSQRRITTTARADLEVERELVR